MSENMSWKLIDIYLCKSIKKVILIIHYKELPVGLKHCLKANVTNYFFKGNFIKTIVKNKSFFLQILS